MPRNAPNSPSLKQLCQAKHWGVSFACTEDIGNQRWVIELQSYSEGSRVLLQKREEFEMGDWNGLNYETKWNECAQHGYDAIWCYIMLYESIRTPPLVLVGRQTRWTWTSSAKKKQTQNSLQCFFSRKIQSNIYNDIIVFVFFPFRVAWLHQSTNLAISRKTLEGRFHLSFSEFRMSWDSQGLQNSYGSVKGMAFQRLRASWSTPEWVHCGPPCKQSMCAWCWMDLDGWPFWSFL